MPLLSRPGGACNAATPLAGTPAGVEVSRRHAHLPPARTPRRRTRALRLHRESGAGRLLLGPLRPACGRNRSHLGPVRPPVRLRGNDVDAPDLRRALRGAARVRMDARQPVGPAHHGPLRVARATGGSPRHGLCGAAHRSRHGRTEGLPPRHLRLRGRGARRRRQPHPLRAMRGLLLAREPGGLRPGERPHRAGARLRDLEPHLRGQRGLPPGARLRPALRPDLGLQHREHAQRSASPPASPCFRRRTTCPTAGSTTASSATRSRAGRSSRPWPAGRGGTRGFPTRSAAPAARCGRSCTPTEGPASGRRSSPPRRGCTSRSARSGPRFQRAWRMSMKASSWKSSRGGPHCFDERLAQAGVGLRLDRLLRRRPQADERSASRR